VSETFHRRGHHIQSAHGRRAALAADTSHLQGGMIALMPTAADAKRLAFPGGEAADELHCTLFFLGDDGGAWTDEQRDELEAAVRAQAAGLGPVRARVFGVAHWNGDGDKPSWVWSVSDDPGAEDQAGLGAVRVLTGMALEMTHDRPDIPEQHSPWVAHICAAYSTDLTVVRALEKRLGPVTFDRIRLSFGDDDRDIPLGGEALTASALRRDPHEHEAFTDFAEHNRQWEGAVQTTTSRMTALYSGWRTWIREQIRAGADTPEELAGLSLSADQSVDQAADVLYEAMHSLAERAGQSLVREAQKQGVEIPEWSLPDDTVTAAVGGRRLLRSVAQMTADLLATSVLQTAKRVVTGLFTQAASPEQIAAEVDRALADAQDGLLQGQVGTAMSTAQTAGREAVLRAAPPGEYYASEMLDRNTCGPCRAVDGEQFGSLEIAIKAYPVMGYKDCVGPRYGNSCRGMIVARWQPEDEETEPVTAAGDALPFHGTKGQPGYELLHGDSKVTLTSVLDEDQELALREDLDRAYFGGFTPHEYNAFTDPGSYDYDPDEELEDGQVNYVEWEGLARYYASGAGDAWYSDFEGSRRIRRAANELAGLDQTGHDRLLGDAEPDDNDRNAALGLLMGVATAPRLDRELYRGSYYAGSDPDEVEAQLRSTDSLDFSVVSFTDGQGVADYFADPSLYEGNSGETGSTGTQVMYVVEPGAQGVLGHVFSKGMQAGDPGDDPDESEYVESDEALTDWTQERPREIVTGGNFAVGDIVREGNRITVRLRQTRTYPPRTSS
jgi:2'-5' RNA ligase